MLNKLHIVSALKPLYRVAAGMQLFLSWCLGSPRSWVPLVLRLHRGNAPTEALPSVYLYFYAEFFSAGLDT